MRVIRGGAHVLATEPLDRFCEQRLLWLERADHALALEVFRRWQRERNFSAAGLEVLVEAEEVVGKPGQPRLAENDA
jgi:hypothetical protein